MGPQQGKGRVFYTAWGHDQRTWGHPGFQNLVERAFAGRRTRERSSTAGRDARPAEAVRVRRGGRPIPNYPGAWGTKGEPIRQMQKPLAGGVDEAPGAPAGFEAQLFAAEPDDRQADLHDLGRAGRLWIAESTDYPNEMQPTRQGQRPDHDLRRHRRRRPGRQVHGLRRQPEHPHQLVFADGGVDRPPGAGHVFLKDTDGDDKADVRKVLFTGWGTGDTHAGPSNLRYGFDNWI